MIHAPQSSPGLRRLPASLALLSILAAAAALPATAQQRRSIRPTTVHTAPGGTRLARLPDAATLAIGTRRAGWTQVTLDGWVSRSLLAPNRRDGFDLVVRADEVRLRLTPGGEEIALLDRGMLLDRVQARGSWTRVRRTVWVASGAVGRDDRDGRDGQDGQGGQGGQVAVRSDPIAAAAVRPRDDSLAPTALTPAAYRPMDQAQTPTAAPGRTTAVERIEAARTAPLYASPGGAQIGTVQAGTAGRVVGRAGDWVRIETEAWVRESDLRPASGGALVGVTAAEVRANPSRYVGQVLEWRVQYVSTAVADELRPEMPPGQPYVLARGPLPEPGFVYIMVAPEELARVKALPALSELVVRVAVRSARSRFLATPVVELRALISSSATAR